MSTSAVGRRRDRHHFIPQYLPRAFTFAAKKGRRHVHVYCRDEQHFPATTVNVAVGGGFYDGPSEVDVEASLDKKEDRYARFLQACEIGPPDPATAAEFLVHLAMRTKNVRDSLTKTFEVGIDAVKELAGGPDFENYLNSLLLKQIKKWDRTRAGPLFRRQLGLPEAGKIKKIPPGVLVRLLQGNQPGDLIRAFLDLALAQKPIKTMAAEAHHEAMVGIVTDPNGPARAAELQKLTWRVVAPKGGLLILGDIRSFAVPAASPTTFVPLVAPAASETLAAYLPIGPDLLLLGSRGDWVDSANVLNEASAGLSRDFFVSAFHDAALLALSHTIDTAPTFISKEQLHDSIPKHLRERT